MFLTRRASWTDRRDRTTILRTRKPSVQGPAVDGRSAEPNLDALFEALPAGMALVDADMRYVRVNERFAALNGITAEDHIGRSVRELLGERADGAYAGGDRTQAFRDALIAGAHAEAARIRAETAREDAERARQEADAQRRAAESARRRASFLARTTHKLAASLDVESTLHEVVASAVPTIADWCMVSIVESDGSLRPISAVHHDPARCRLAEQLAAHYIPGPQSSLTRLRRTGRPVLLTGLTPENLREIVGDETCARWMAQLGTEHVASWPILSPEGELIGAVSLVLGDSGRSFSHEDLELARALGSRAGLHITNARLYTEHSRIARALQASLLPRALPDIAGVELASVFLPAGQEVSVGGDFLDVFTSGEGAWGAIIGDVAGKGAEAAAVTGIARTALRTAALVDPSPRSNLAVLNELLLADPATARYLTAVSTRLVRDGDNLSITVASAGHPTPLVLRADGTVEQIVDAQGPLVGVFAGVRYIETEVTLVPGELMLLYTDGVTETRTGDQEFNDGKLRVTLGRCAGRRAHEVADAVRAFALALHEGEARDDIAALIIRSCQTEA
jgi:serine phosphatase RsbU (regulator of sigma subunit)/PAS domain-containing protein